MAAYASLTSLKNLIHQIQNHPSPPISIEKQQLESLIETATSLQLLLETYHSPVADSDEADPLEMRIADAAYAVEDVIESYIVDNIKLAAETTHDHHDDDEQIEVEEINCITFYKDMQKVIEEMDLMAKEVTEMVGEKAAVEPQLQRNDSTSREADPLEMRIADAAYAAEDVIESHIVDAIKLGISTTTSHKKFDSGEGTSASAGLRTQRKSKISFDYFGCLMKPINQGKKITLYQGLRKVINDMSAIKKEVMKISKGKNAVEAQLRRIVSTSAAVSSRSSSIMVGFDDVLLQILDKITAEKRRRQVIPIVGMGGIGKTTLARHLYAHPLIQEHFDICAWATISQKYNTKEILCDLLSETKRKGKEELSDMSEDELGSELHKCLFSRRFLIVMDDMWSIEAWDEIQRFFPDNGNRSRIVVTTRLSSLGYQLNSSYCMKMKFLDEVSSWNLYLKTVFGEERCPIELNEIGKKIVETCKGLPMAIVVMGGLLKNLEQTQECWESIRKNLSSVVNSENEDFCLKILKLSYNHLPVYLKPCFLYMGVFEEDRTVCVSTLVKLWVCEGFLKPISDKTLEMAAKEYLNDLVDRNLVLVHELGCTGNIKYCKIHDLLRDLCLREAGKLGFYNVIGQHMSQRLNNRQRCVVIPGSTSKEEVDGAMRCMPLARSFLCDSNEAVRLPESRLLRIIKSYDAYGSRDYMLDDLFGFVNSRYLAIGVHWKSEFPSLVDRLWNLQTLIIFHSYCSSAPQEIWKMPQLRHVEFHKGGLYLPYQPSGNIIVVMKNLQTLKGVNELNWDDAYKTIPNIKKLGVSAGVSSNLIHLSKLESFHCWDIYNERGLHTFPYSLKKLSLGSNRSRHWELNEENQEMIGALPLLQKLKLERARFQRRQAETSEDKYLWETSEDRFPSLKYLELKRCLLKSWKTESSHFPRLERLRLYELKELEEIPSEIGEIPTLQSIVLEYCSESAVVSAKNITEEQEDIRVRLVLLNTDKNQALQSLATPNFLVEIDNF